MNEYKYDEIKVGHKESFPVIITKEMEDSFRSLTGDINPLHFDDEYAISVMEGARPSHITFGMMTASFLSTLAGIWLPGKYSLIHSVEVGFSKPVYAEDILTVSGVVVGKIDELRLLLLKAQIVNQEDIEVLQAKMKVLVLK